jgi:hypothetical protein
MRCKQLNKHRAAGTLSTGFINIEGLKNKFQRKDFSDLLKVNEVFGITESWSQSEKYEIRGYRDVNRNRCKKIKYGRNPGGFVVNIKMVLKHM